MYRKKYYILVLIIIAVLSSAAIGQVNDPDCNSKLTKKFTKRIVKNGRTLYIINKNYLLVPYFDDKCRLIQIDVSNSARWKNPDEYSDEDKDFFLTSEEYRKVIGRIDSEFPLGNSLDSDKIGLSSPRGTISWGRSQNAYMQITSIDNKKGNGIVSFTIYFAHEVYGELGNKFLFNQPGFIKKAKLEINNKLYWSDELTFMSANLNKSGTFKVFGGSQ